MSILASNVWSMAFAAALVVSSALMLWLDARQIRHVLAHRHAVPKPFDVRVGLDAHQKAADYTAAKARLHRWVMVWGGLVTVGWTFLGGLQALDTWLQGAVHARWGGMAYQLALLGAVVLAGSLLEVPFDLYRTFKLEARFGFNRTTWKLWLTDGIKGALVTAAIGLPLAAALLGLMAAAGRAWWVWAWALFVAVQCLMLVLFPTLIAPLFNRFVALEDTALRERAQSLMARCGFQSRGFFVMDASRRSAHGNAYFTGFGSAKRVVFFDTLLQRLSHAETEAVLAHELGHFHHKHMVKRVAMLAFLSLAAFALLGWLTQQAWFFEGLGVSSLAVLAGAPRDAVAVVLFMLAMPPFLWFASPWMAWTSRRDEFQADAFAKRVSDGHQLSSALLKLYEDNAGTLTPDPWYVWVYASHPPASERMAALAAR